MKYLECYTINENYILSEQLKRKVDSRELLLQLIKAYIAFSKTFETLRDLNRISLVNTLKRYNKHWLT